MATSDRDYGSRIQIPPSVKLGAGQVVRKSPGRSRPYHPQTQGKIERWHRTMKNVVKLENYYFPGELKLALKDFVAYDNNERYHESLQNVTPADVYFGRQHQILSKRERIKRSTMKERKRLYRANKAA
jgi:transposase InsO family protein